MSRHLWHHRLGHPSNELVSVFFKNLEIFGNLSGTNKDVCDVCFRAKQTRSRFSISENKAGDLFELIHCDIWGPYKVKASCGANYFLTIVDDGSRATWVYLMQKKGEVGLLLKGFVAMTSNQFKKNVKIVRSDNGLEFKFGTMQKLSLIHI